MFYVSISIHIRILGTIQFESSPKMRPTVDQVKDLSRIEKLLKASQEFHSLVVATFGVDKHQEGTST